MNQFRKILRFELKNYLCNKVFVGVTVFLLILIAGVSFFPRLKDGFSTAAPDTHVSTESLPLMLIKAPSEDTAAQVEAGFADAFPEYRVSITTDDDDAIRDQIIAGTAECAFLLDSLTSYTYYVNNLSMYDENTETADTVLQELYRTNTLVSAGFTSEDATQILSMPILHETKSLGKDQMQNFFYTYIMIFALYMVILLYGQMVATNVATEKSSRAMELLITSAKPVSMMFGKILASCIAGFLQLFCIFGFSLLCFRLNKGEWDSSSILTSIFGMPVSLFVYMLVFFLLGFLIYAFLFGAVGSTASKLEDINTSVMPVTMLFVIAFLVVVVSMTSGNVDTLLLKICSFIPFTSPMAMFTRIAMSTVPFYEIAASIVILIASVIGIGILSAKIYRLGVLMYGNPPKLTTILKNLK